MHTNSGACTGCQVIINRYLHLHPILLNWFMTLQSKKPEVHTFCAGRGYVEQELDFKRNVSRAHWGESAHNYNLALDLFGLSAQGKAIFTPLWYISLLDDSGTLPKELLWYGNEGPYREYPHVEVRNWRALITTYPLVEYGPTQI